jgi:hypothetical protein
MPAIIAVVKVAMLFPVQNPEPSLKRFQQVCQA